MTTTTNFQVGQQVTVKGMPNWGICTILSIGGKSSGQARIKTEIEPSRVVFIRELVAA